MLYLSLPPQFIDPARGGVPTQSLLPAATRIAIILAVNAAIAVFAGSAGGSWSGVPPGPAHSAG
ncbi:MAG TPA: hypothetical protein VK325_12345 [Pseudoxanthomonas sp.]|nr:hypothetical protein [Pseudoxanthomonas sp.]